MNYIKLAWRNLWRNKRRTAITSASILFAVFFALLMRSFQLGFYDHMIKNTIESFSGFIQVQHIDYKDEPVPENTFSCSDSLLNFLRNIDGVKAAVPRIETFALASTGNLTKGVLVMGIDPEGERELINPEHLMVRYRFNRTIIDRLKEEGKLSPEIQEKLDILDNKAYSNTGTIAMDLTLNENKYATDIGYIAKAGEFEGYPLKQDDNGVLVSSRLARFLKVSVGDTLILMGQGYQGSTAAGLYPVRGLIQLPNIEFDNKLIFMTLQNAQKFIGFDDQVSVIAINLDDNRDKNLPLMQGVIENSLQHSGITVKNWKEFNEVLAQQIESDSQSGIAFMALLYFIIFFGIFGTVLMMIHERHREFGVLVAIGMKKIKLAIILVFEMIFMGAMGVAVGVVISLPFLYYFHNYPIRLTGDMAQVMEDYGFDPVMPLAWIDMYVLWQGLVVGLMVVLACIYPLRKLFIMKEIEALHT